MKGLRDELARYLPSWLADLEPEKPSFGYRVLWSLALQVDAAIDASLLGALASEAKGPAAASALKYVAEERGIVRGRVESDASHIARLRKWIELHKDKGSQYGLAREVRNYVGNMRVRVINRGGLWTTINADGTVELHEAEWDWDSVSNPERNTGDHWSEQFIVIYDSPYDYRPNQFGDGIDYGQDGFGIGHMVPRAEREELRRVIGDWKAGRSFVRAAIWTTNDTLFDPEVPSSCPDGTWGRWYVPSGGRDITGCRYWEFTKK